MNVHIKVDKRAFDTNLRRGMQQFERRQAVTLTGVATVVREEANKIVPVDTGQLQDSGRVLPPVGAGTPVSSVTVRYGDEKAYYALIVHEDLEMRHDPGKTAKFLEKPTNKSMPLMVKSLMATLRMSFK
jgi:hypothetical protein